MRGHARSGRACASQASAGAGPAATVHPRRPARRGGPRAGTRRAGFPLLLLVALVANGCGPLHLPSAPPVRGTPPRPPAVAGPRWLPAASVPPRRPALWDISFVSAETGWAAAQSGTTGVLLHTTDGGRNWLVQQVLPHPATGITFRTPTLGWATVGHTLYRTTDGGQTWSAEYTGPDRIEAPSFPTAERGWTVVSGPQGFHRSLLHTADGGRSWAVEPDPCGTGLLAGVSFPTPADGWVMCGRRSDPFGAAILATTDAGGSWAAVSPLPGGAGKPAGILFASATEGFALFAFGAGGGGMLRTTDGGRSWSPVAGLPGNLVVGLSFPTPGQGVALSLSCGGRALYTSTDGGAVWHLRSPPPAPASCGPAAIAGSGDSLYAEAAAGRILQSSDGGRTWQIVTAAAPVLGLSAPGGEVLYAADADTFGAALARSTDGGLRWHEGALLPPIAGRIAAISFPTAAVGYVVAGNGVLYRTTDEGVSLTEVGRTPTYFYRIDFPTPDDGWAVTGGGRLFRTTDGGATWSAVTLPKGLSAPDDVSFASPRDGMAVLTRPGPDSAAANGVVAAAGNTLVLLATTDGGATWTARPLPLGSAQAFEVIAPGTALLLSGRGLLRSIDGGATWSYAALSPPPCPQGGSPLSGGGCSAG